MRISRTWLLMLAAIALAAPVFAQNAAQNADQDVNAPESHWQSAANLETASVSWTHIAEDAGQATQQAPAANDQQNSAPPPQT